MVAFGRLPPPAVTFQSAVRFVLALSCSLGRNATQVGRLNLSKADAQRLL